MIPGGGWSELMGFWLENVECITTFLVIYEMRNGAFVPKPIAICNMICVPLVADVCGVLDQICGRYTILDNQYCY